MKLFSVTDGYIEYLRTEHRHVYSNKEDTRIHTRKYIGVVIEIGSYCYFIPLSSPKDKDYFIKDNIRKIKKDTFLIWRIVSGSGGGAELRATIRFANMIPVPTGELIEYNISTEPDVDYKNLVQEEQEYIRKRSQKIIKRANVIYKNKIAGNRDNVYQYCLDYKDLERMHDEWISYVTSSSEQEN